MRVCGNQPSRSEEDAARSSARDIVRMQGGKLNKKIKVFDGGVRIGCTYVTRGAIRAIMRKIGEV